MSSPSGDHSNYDMRQAEDAWKNFNRLSTWTLGCVIVLVIFMAIFLTGGHPPKPM